MARPTSRVTRVEITGPLAPFVAAYRLRLQESGYTPLSIVNEVRQVAHLSRWLEAGHMTGADLTSERVEQFLAVRRAGGHGACSLGGLMPVLEVLRGLGILSEDQALAPTSGSEVLLAWFRTYLLEERGLATCTADAYVDRACRFLAGCGIDGELATLTAADVTRAVQRESARVSVGSAQFFVAGLRSFLRFCFLQGLVGADLSAAGLAVTGRRRSLLPKGISYADAVAVSRSCDRRRSAGRRDEDRLPLPADVGEAIVGYLQRGRPTTTRREVFLRALAPIGPLGRGGVSSIVRRACRRAGVAPVGAHRLRHTLACEMVAARVPLPEIGQVLRQRSISSTAIYARVDLESLRELALPWPGGEQR